MKTRTCPRCLQRHSDYPATSRRDNKTEICSACGTEEAMVDFARNRNMEQNIPVEALEREVRFISIIKKED